MIKTKHIVLPVRSWQYVGLLVISLACLTFGLISRGREERLGNCVGPKLVYASPHERDLCPNDDHACYFLSFDSSSKLTFAVLLDNLIPTENRDSFILVHESRLNGNHSDVTRLILNQIQVCRLHELRMQTAFTKSQIIPESQNRRIKSSKFRDIRVLHQFEDRIISMFYKTNRQYNIQDLQIYKFKHDHRVVPKLLIIDQQINEFKIRFVGELYDSYFKQRSFVKSELRKKQMIQRNLVRKLRVKNPLNFQTYSSSKSEDRYIRAAKNELNSQQKYRIIYEKSRIKNHIKILNYHIKNELGFQSNRKLRNTKYQFGNATNRHDFKITRQRKQMNGKYCNSNSEIKCEAHNSLTVLKSINQKYLRGAIKNQFVAGEKHRKTSELKNRHIRLNKNIQIKKYIREIFKLENRRFRSLEDILKKKRNIFKLDIRNFKIKISRIENSENREVSQLQNRHILSMEESYIRRIDLERKILRRYYLTNRQRSASRREMTEQEHENRLANSLNIDRKPKEVQRDNRIMDKIQLRKNQNINRRDKQQILMFAIQENKQKNSLTKLYRRNQISQKLRGFFAERIQITNYESRQATNFPDQHQINKNRLDKTHNERRIERQMNMPVEHVNLKTNLMRFLKIKITSMDPQYVKPVIIANNIDYEIFRQGIVIAFCTIYGACIFNCKTALIGKRLLKN